MNYPNLREKISVIIPACNEEYRLPIALKFLQVIKRVEYPNLEIIVSINGSRNPSALKLIAQRNGARAIHSAKGPSAARNAGALASSGEILIFMDADVLLQPGVISRIAGLVKKNTVGTCTAYPDTINIKALLLAWVKNLVRSTGLLKGMSELVFCHRSLLIEKKIGFDPQMKLGEIHDFFSRAIKEGQAKYTYVHMPMSERWKFSVNRYERNGYIKTLIFWVRWWFFTRLLKRDSKPFEQEYWVAVEPD